MELIKFNEIISVLYGQYIILFLVEKKQSYSTFANIFKQYYAFTQPNSKSISNEKP